MEIDLSPGGELIAVRTMHMDMDELTILINSSIDLSPKFPNADCGVTAMEQLGGGWNIFIRTDIADANIGFARLIVRIAKYFSVG